MSTLSSRQKYGYAVLCNTCAVWCTRLGPADQPVWWFNLMPFGIQGQWGYKNALSFDPLCLCPTVIDYVIDYGGGGHISKNSTLCGKPPKLDVLICVGQGQFEINLSIPILDWFWCIPSSVFCVVQPCRGLFFPEKTHPWCFCSLKQCFLHSTKTIFNGTRLDRRGLKS